MWFRFDGPKGYPEMDIRCSVHGTARKLNTVTRSSQHSVSTHPSTHDHHHPLSQRDSADDYCRILALVCLHSCTRSEAATSSLYIGTSSSHSFPFWILRSSTSWRFSPHPIPLQTESFCCTVSGVPSCACVMLGQDGDG